MVCHGSHQYTPVMLAFFYQHHGSVMGVINPRFPPEIRGVLVMLLWVFAACDSADTLAHGHESMLARHFWMLRDQDWGNLNRQQTFGIFHGIGDFSMGFNYQRMDNLTWFHHETLGLIWDSLGFNDQKLDLRITELEFRLPAWGDWTVRNWINCIWPKESWTWQSDRRIWRVIHQYLLKLWHTSLHAGLLVGYILVIMYLLSRLQQPH